MGYPINFEIKGNGEGLFMPGFGNAGFGNI
jgi:hypothetical protein